MRLAAVRACYSPVLPPFPQSQLAEHSRYETALWIRIFRNTVKKSRRRAATLCALPIAAVSAEGEFDSRPRAQRAHSGGVIRVFGRSLLTALIRWEELKDRKAARTDLDLIWSRASSEGFSFEGFQESDDVTFLRWKHVNICSTVLSLLYTYLAAVS